MVQGSKVKKPRRYSKHPQEGYIVKGRVWVEKDGELYLGWGRVKLLENIEKLGSMSAAAKTMKLGYRNAWLWVDSMNRLAPSPLVEKVTGGTGGGFAKLTEEGRKVIAYYNGMHEKLQKLLESDRDAG